MGLASGITLHIMAPNQGQNFDGTFGDDPPDVNGAVGPKYFLQTTNFQVAFFDKGTGASVSDVDINTFWSNASASTGTPCDSSHRGDPVALYDGAADRYIVTDFAWPSGTIATFGPFYECIAISKTSDPIAGGWYLYALPSGNAGADPANGWLPDYPKLGVWPDGYYMMADLFRIIPNPTPPPTNLEQFQTVRVWALDRTAMLSGGAMSPISFDVANVFSMVPTNLTGTATAPPAGRVNYFGVTDYPDPSQNETSTAIHIYQFHADFATPANSTFTGPTDITVPVYTSPSAAPAQLGSNNLLDTLGTRLMYQLQYRNIGGTESLWAVHTVDNAGVNAIRWYQFNVTGGTIATTPVQSGTFSPDNTFRWMGHLAADRFGNMAVQYSASSASINPGVRFTGRLSTDTAGTLQTEATLTAGAGAFEDCSPTAPATTCVARWGDYSSMQVDPVDDCTFWFTNEYATAGHAAVTRIGSARFAGCTTDVEIAKTHSPTPVLAGQQLTYQLTAHNYGPVGAYAVTVSDALAYPYVSFTAPLGWDCSHPLIGSTGTFSCTGVLASGASAVFSVTVLAPNIIGNASNTATIATASTNTAAPSTTTSADLAAVISPSDVTGVKTVIAAPNTLRPGYSIQYQVVLTNESDYDQFDGSGDEFTDPLPATLILNGASATSGTATTLGNTVHWNGAIAAHSSVTITIDVTIAPDTFGMTISNLGTIHYDVDGDGTNAGTRTASVSFTVESPIDTLSIVGRGLLILLLLTAGVFLLVRRL